MKNNVLIFAVILVIVAAGSFFAGTKYQQSQRGSFNFTQNGGTRGRFGTGNITGGNNNSRAIRGEILNTDDSSITVKLADGSSKIVLYSDKSTINKAQVGTKADLKAGEQVMVFGTNNSDGSVTAQNIQINPQFPGGTGGPDGGNGNR